MIKSSDFINIDISTTSITSSEKNKVVVYLTGGASDYTYTFSNSASVNKADSKGSILPDGNAKEFCKQFFNCGGQTIKVIVVGTGGSSASTTNMKSNNELFLKAIEDLSLEEVAFVVEESQNYSSSADTYDGQYNMGVVDESVTGLYYLINKLDSLENKGSAYRKLLVKQITSVGSATLSDKNVVYKLTTSAKDLASVLAYLSKVSLEDEDSFKDYCFTKENTCSDMKQLLSDYSWSDIKDKINVSTSVISTDIINLGGNTSAGTDLIQEFVVIYLSQEILKAEWALLKTKITTLDAPHLVYTTILNILENYYDVNYLIPVTYTGNTIYKHINNENIEILAKNEVITGGYKIVLLPKTSTSDIHKLQDVMIVLNTAKGIRYIDNVGLIL